MYTCAADDTSCASDQVGKTFINALCATDELCAAFSSVQGMQTYVGAKCCATDSCNDPMAFGMSASAVGPTATCYQYASSTPSKRLSLPCDTEPTSTSTSCLSYQIKCTEVSEDCTAAQVGQTFVVAACASDMLCKEVVEDPRAAMFYAGAACCKATNCNDPLLVKTTTAAAATVADSGSATASADATTAAAPSTVLAMMAVGVTVAISFF